MPGDPRPVCLVTGAVSPYRREPFRLLAEAQGAEVLACADAGPPVRGPRRAPHHSGRRGRALVASGRYRAVIVQPGRAGRAAGTYAAARRRRDPVRALGHDLGAPPHPGPRALAAGHPPPLPPRRRGGHLRGAREPPRGGVPRRARERVRGASGGRRGALRRARCPTWPGTRRARGPAPATAQLLVLFVGQAGGGEGRAGAARRLADRRPGRGRAAGGGRSRPPRGARGSGGDRRPARLATLPNPSCRPCTRRPTSSWCHPSEPQLSPSRGGWS